MTRDIAFLFGAGASFGAGSIRPERPPLGSDLYPTLAKLYPHSWGRFPDDIVDSFKVDGFEHGMDLIYQRYGPAIPQLMREMAIYFVQFRPVNKSSLYCRLIREMKESNHLFRATFATLNYDCLFEFSIVEHGLNLHYFEDDSGDGVVVRKLHGSCNFFSAGIQAGPDVGYGTGVVWEGGIEAFLDSNIVIEKCLVSTGLAPVMCLYMEGKPLAVSPSSVKQMQEDWSKCLATASALFCVGVRPWPQDTHIWNPIAECDCPVFFIGAEDEVREWAGQYRSRATEHLGDRFNSGFSKLLSRVRAL